MEVKLEGFRAQKKCLRPDHCGKDAHGVNARCPLMRVGVELTYN